MAEEENKEREKHLLKKEKGKLYSQELLKQMQENALKREQEAKLEKERAEHVWEYDRKWRQEVATERKKMIEEHVPSLLGYLQAGVVKKEDIPTIRAGANKQGNLAHLDIEAMAISKRPQRFSKCNPQCQILKKY